MAIVIGTPASASTASELSTSVVITGITAAANSVVFAALHSDENLTPATQTINSITTDSGGTTTSWTRLGSIQHTDSNLTLDVWYAYTTAGLSAGQITINYAQANDTVGTFMSATGTAATSGDPTLGWEGTNTASGNTRSPAVSVTSTVDNALPLGWIGTGRTGSANAYTPAADQTEQLEVWDTTFAEGVVLTKTTVVSPAGAYSLGTANGLAVSAQWLMKGIALKPAGAAGGAHGLSALGVGT